MKFLIVILIILSFSCSKKVNDQKIADLNFNRDKEFSFLIGKTINELNLILDDTIKTNKTLFLYNGFDCSSCINSGFKIVKTIDSIKKSNYVKVISITSNNSNDQFINQYRTYIFTDIKDLIRKNLKYINTPVFIKVNEDNVITSIFFHQFASKAQIDSFSFKSI